MVSLHTPLPNNNCFNKISYSKWLEERGSCMFTDDFIGLDEDYNG